MNLTKVTFLLTTLVFASYGLTGCGQPEAPIPQTTAKADQAAQTDVDEHDHGKAPHEHGEWWCNEHGVPEAICAQCNSKLAAEFQKKGDWCEKHDRPDSQCFVCHPELEAKFAAQYEAKYGKKPPQHDADEDDHHHHEEGKKT